MKILHFADVHYSRETQDKALASLRKIVVTTEKEKPDLIALAGDLFERPVNDTESSGFPALLDVFGRLLDIAPIAAVRGTTTHDVPGCYAPFERLKAKYPFRLLTQPSSPHFLSSLGHIEGDVWSEENIVSEGYARLLLFGIPEPSKEWFLAGKQLGKAEANEAIKKGMRELLLGLAALRKQYPTLPCIVIYHGAVSGATLDNHQILPAGGIQIGKDDLALVGADYYALGHIHLFQQIGGLPAFYSGSVFPVDRGEQDQKGFNLVSFTMELPEHWDNTIATFGDGDDADFFVHVQRIPYPHPPRKKIVCVYNPENDEDMIDLNEAAGYDTWLQIRARKEQRSMIDTEAWREKLLAAGAEEGSKVEVVPIPTETVRSQEISDTHHLRDKVKIYAELSGEKVSESILEKADTIEQACREQGIISEGLHIRIKKLILRGAIGIHKGIGRDQVEIDLDQYDPGLIALVGANGSGKTTLCENMHPFPQLFTRPGKLQDHFMLRDSFRDLYFIDDRTGTEYRAFLQIDGLNKSGSIEYYLYRDGKPLTNGRKDDYEQKVQELFGSPQLFLRHVFASQKQPKNLPDLSDASKGEKKALFLELGGLNIFIMQLEYAKSKAQDINNELIGIRAKLEREGDVRGNIAHSLERMERLEEEENEAQQKLNKIGEKGKRLRARSEDLAKLVEKNKELYQEIDATNKRILELNQEKNDLKQNVQKYREALNSKQDLERELKHLEALKKEEAELNEERARISAERERLTAKHNNAKDVVANTERKYQSRKTETIDRKTKVLRDRAILEAEGNTLDKELAEPITENCPTCGQKWPASKKAEFQAKRDEKQQKLNEIRQKIFDFDKKLKEIEHYQNGLDESLKELEWPEEPELPTFNEEGLQRIKIVIREKDESVLRNELQKAQIAEAQIAEGEKRLESLEQLLSELMKKNQDLKEQVHSSCEQEHQEILRNLENARNEYIEKDKELTRINTEIQSLQKTVDQLKAELEEIEDLKKQAEEKEGARIEWEWLQRACGPDGIQALELDAMGPGIAEVANSILESAYGSRFQMEFRTTRIGGSGSKRKQIEDFQIWIHDSQDGTEQLLEMLSGGESVWVKRAIYDAFGIIRARKEGTKFLTVHQDEADGALDEVSGARIKYFRLLLRAHQEAGRYHTIVITHSTEAQEMIGQKIDMRQLSPGEEVPAF